MSNGEGGGGPVPPYGTAIRRAISRGRIHEMKAVAEAAREALYKVEFAPVADEDREDVTQALQELERAIKRLEK